MTPITLTLFSTPEGCHGLIAQYPLSGAMRARHLPALTHNGRTYVPYTGTVIDTTDRVLKHGKACGFYMEYRALHNA